MVSIKELSEELEVSESYIYKIIREDIELFDLCKKKGRKKYITDEGVEKIRIKLGKYELDDDEISDEIKQNLNDKEDTVENIDRVEILSIDKNSKNEIYFLQNELLNKNLIIENLQNQINRLLDIIDNQENMKNRELDIIDQQILAQRNSEERLFEITEFMKNKIMNKENDNNKDKSIFNFLFKRN
ncbi:hypothetical protein [Clostridium thermobutyricum]|uniref:hypothetical protein n=1 Tax=Clostridium thermobutyricum TaxID=29372 RepID=UPI0018AA1139|nr:hypothetical protein [Clostridium thermobutyricum]